VILSSSKPDDIVLDPFFGSGTTGAVAKKLHRHWIGIEREDGYIQVAQKRIDAVQPESFDKEIFDVRSKSKTAPKVEFFRACRKWLLAGWAKLYFLKDKTRLAMIKPDAHLRQRMDLRAVFIRLAVII